MKKVSIQAGDDYFTVAGTAPGSTAIYAFTLPWGARGTIEDWVEIFTAHEETHA